MFKDKISWIILALIALVLTSYRATNYSEKEISWDILGYYLPLPATFIYNDPMLNDRTWVEKLNQEKNLSGTLYQISSNDEGKPMYFFLFGMALFYLPFFFIGHLWAQISDYPPDGFSFPYQYSLLIGGIIYTLIGLFYLRKILKHYFSESMTAILLVLVVFATNYIHHLTLKNIETVNILFTLVTIVLWNTIQWHRFHHLKNLLSIGIGITLMSLVKPSEIFILLIPLFWMVDSKATWIAKRQLIWQYRLQFVFVLFACVIIALPQMMYWYVKTGKLFYDSYKNPGVGLDILNPHIFEVLFSYRKGWLLYTPIMIFALIGFYFLYKKNRKLFLPLIIYFLSSFYIIASWTEWWYGAGFSNRPVITMYPILAIALGYFLVELQTKNYFLKIVVGVTCLWFLVLNQFQWWQFKNYILDATRVTKEYYWATFLKTYNTEEDKGLLLVARDYTGIHDFSNMDNYEVKDVRTIKIENEKQDSTGFYYQMGEQIEYSPTIKYKYKELTGKDHVWIVSKLKIRFPKETEGSKPCLVQTMEHRGGAYGYLAPEIQAPVDGEWHEISLAYLTPEIRNKRDLYKCFIWKRSSTPFDIKDFSIEIYEKRD